MHTLQRLHCCLEHVKTHRYTAASQQLSGAYLQLFPEPRLPRHRGQHGARAKVGQQAPASAACVLLRLRWGSWTPACLWQCRLQRSSRLRLLRLLGPGRSLKRPAGSRSSVAACSCSACHSSSIARGDGLCVHNSPILCCKDLMPMPWLGADNSLEAGVMFWQAQQTFKKEHLYHSGWAAADSAVGCACRAP